jgi:hypothetical protein
MPRPTKKAKTKAAKAREAGRSGRRIAEPEAAPAATGGGRTAARGIAAADQPRRDARSGKGRAPAAEKTEDKDRIAASSINIAKLQAMSMTELNQMARDWASRTSARCASTR